MENTHKTAVPVNKKNIKNKQKNTDTDNVGNSNQGDVKVKDFSETNINKLFFCEKKKNEHVNEVETLHKTNKNTKIKQKETECVENTNTFNENKVSSDCDKSQMSLGKNPTNKNTENFVSNNTEQVNDELHSVLKKITIHQDLQKQKI